MLSIVYKKSEINNLLGIAAPKNNKFIFIFFPNIPQN